MKTRTTAPQRAGAETDLRELFAELRRMNRTGYEAVMQIARALVDKKSYE